MEYFWYFVIAGSHFLFITSVPYYQALVGQSPFLFIMFIRAGWWAGIWLQAPALLHLPPAHINHPLARDPMHYHVGVEKYQAHGPLPGATTTSVI